MLSSYTSRRQTTDGGDDAAYAADLDFNATQGRRYAAALGMLKDKLAAVAMLSLALILEPLRFVTAWLMIRAREAMDQSARRPVLHLLYAPYSSPLMLASTWHR